LTGYRNRLGAVLSWWLAFTRDLRRERTFTTRDVAKVHDVYGVPPQSLAAMGYPAAVSGPAAGGPAPSAAVSGPAAGGPASPAPPAPPPSPSASGAPGAPESGVAGRTESPR